MQRRTKAAVGGTALIASLALVLAGCSATDAGTTPTDGAAATFALMDTTTGECSVAPADGVDYDAATAYIEQFEQPSEGIIPDLLGWEPLPEPLPAGVTIGYANNMSPVGDGLWRPFIEQAAETAGATFVNYPAGPDPASSATGFDAIVSDPPDILVVGAIDPTIVTAQAKALQDAGVTLVWGADPRAAETLGLNDSLGGQGGSIVNGEVMAAAAVYFTCGTGSEFVWYGFPEFQFSAVNFEGASSLLSELAPDANLRSVDISVFATDNPNGIVQDLQGHPETQFFITPGDQDQIGLGAAALTAGVTNAQGIGQSSLPQNIAQIKDGSQFGGFTVDFQAFLFQLVDEGLRKYEGVFPTAGYGDDWQKINSNISSVITAQNVNELNIGEDSNFYSYANTVADYAAAWGK
jgi:ribose transport system substrate-binding protein